MTKTTGAFGGNYNHETIKQLRSELAKSRLMLSALAQHTGTTEEQMMKICADYIVEVQGHMKAKAENNKTG